MTYQPHKIEMGFITWILENLEYGKTILEFGSGNNTKYLAEQGQYKFYSVEHNKKWLKYSEYTSYIYAPIIMYNNPLYNNVDIGNFPSPHCGWYDHRIVKNQIPKTYDLIFVDGPNGAMSHHPGRAGVWVFREYFSKNVPYIFHDAHRQVEQKLIEKMSEYLERPYEKIDKWSAVIL